MPVILKKDFNFPKMHMLLSHSFEHIHQKGPRTKAMSTKTGEHGHIKFKSDASWTNFVNLGAQVRLGQTLKQ